MAPTKLSKHLAEILDPQKQLPFDDVAGSRPAQPLATRLPIGSLAGMEAALAELGWMDSMQKIERARLDAEIESATERSKGRLVIYVGKTGIAFDDRRQQLRASAEAFWKVHRNQIIPAGAKSRKITHGSFGCEWVDGKIVFVKSPPKRVAAWWDKLADLMLSLLAEAPGLPGRIALCLSTGIKLNRTKTLAAFDAGKIKRADLAIVGCRYIAGANVFFMRPSGQTLESSSQETPNG